MKSKIRSWTIAASVALLPMALAGAAAWILLGGLPDELRRQEREEARLVARAVEAEFSGALKKIAAQPPPELWLLGSEDGRNLDSPFRPLPDPLWLPPAHSLTAQLAERLEGCGDAAGALTLWPKVAQQDLAVLGQIRCLIALGRKSEALSLLNERRFSDEIPPGQSLAFATIAAVQRSRLSSSASAEGTLLREIRRGRIHPPAALISTLLHLSGLDTKDRWRRACNDLEAAAGLWLANRRSGLQLGTTFRLTPGGGGLLPVPSPSGGWLVLPPRIVDRLRSEALAQAQEHHRDWLLSWGDAVGKLSFPVAAAGRSVKLRPKGRPPSRRLELLAGILLAIAGTSFLAGGGFALRLVRRETAISRLRRDFVDVVSHELRTPLAAISMKAEMLAHDEVPKAKISRYHQGLYAEVQRLAALLARLMDFARLERGKAPAKLRSTPARRLLAEGLRSGRSAAQLAGIRLQCEVPRDLPAIEADSELVARALRNLIENAAHHAPESKTIWVRATTSPSLLSFHVEDRGPGVPRNKRSRVFEAFESSAKVNGSGLGLAIVAQTMKLHGGSATVEDRPGGGARFSLHFPMETK